MSFLDLEKAHNFGRWGVPVRGWVTRAVPVTTLTTEIPVFTLSTQVGKCVLDSTTDPLLDIGVQDLKVHLGRGQSPVQGPQTMWFCWFHQPATVSMHISAV